MIGILLLVVIICFVGLKKKSRIETEKPLPLGSKGVAKERLMRDKNLKKDFKVAISKRGITELAAGMLIKKVLFALSPWQRKGNF